MTTPHDFIFRGLLASRGMQELEQLGTLRPKSGVGAENRHADLIGAVDTDIRRNGYQMMKVYFILYLMENLLRKFVRDTLSEVKGDDWLETACTASVKGKIEKRKLSDELNTWHSGRGGEGVNYLDFGDLKDIMLKEWEIFKDFIPSQNWLSSRMDEAERSRNVIAHTNILPDEETVRLDQHLRDWIRQLG